MNFSKTTVTDVDASGLRYFLFKGVAYVLDNGWLNEKDDAAPCSAGSYIWRYGHGWKKNPTLFRAILKGGREIGDSESFHRISRKKYLLFPSDEF